MAARVAAVPSPFSRIASDISFSSRVRPAVSMAVSSVPSERCGGGSVFLGITFAAVTARTKPATRPPGSIGGSFARFGARLSTIFQPTFSTDVPELT